MLVVYAIVGLALGSFLNVMMDRLPARKSLLQPPSHCPGCERRLSALEMAPVLSYIALRGRCRTCGARIPLRVPLVELASGLLFALLWWTYGPSLRLALMTLYTCILLVVLVIDLEHKLVLNVVVLPATVLALAAIPLQRFMAPPSYSQVTFLWLLTRHGRLAGLSPWQVGMVSQLLGGAIAFGIFFLIWFIAPAGMGAGDVKLSAFAGLITAFPGALVAVLGSFILGGLVSMVLLLSGKVGRKTAIPFAPFLVSTTFLMLVYGDQFLFWYLRS